VFRYDQRLPREDYRCWADYRHSFIVPTVTVHLTQYAPAASGQLQLKFTKLISQIRKACIDVLQVLLSHVLLRSEPIRMDDYLHWRRFDWSFDSFCRRCLAKVAHAVDEAELAKYEKDHVCEPLDLAEQVPRDVG
jgi:hypothetical protein